MRDWEHEWNEWVAEEREKTRKIEEEKEKRRRRAEERRQFILEQPKLIDKLLKAVQEHPGFEIVSWHINDGEKLLWADVKVDDFFKEIELVFEWDWRDYEE